MLFQLS